MSLNRRFLHFRVLTLMVFASSSPGVPAREVSAHDHATSAVTTTSSASTRFQQDHFAIGFWVDPPADEKMEERYRQIADANFTLVVGGFGANQTSEIRRQLEYCEKFDMKALVAIPQKNMDKLFPAESSALWGYLWHDEPAPAAFPQVADGIREIRERRPGKLAYVNLLPNYAPAWALGTPDYPTHVRRFIEEADPDVLSMDHYPQFRPDAGADGRSSYLECVAVMREESLKAGIPYWNFFNTMPFGPHSDPTEGQIRWQVYASLAHGAKGVLWFCYYTPAGGEFPKGGAIIARDDRPTRHYDQARRINAELKHLGPTLMKLTSTRVLRMTSAGIKPSAVVTDGASTTTLANASGEPAAEHAQNKPFLTLAGDPPPDCLVGEFRHEDGRRAVLLHNYEFAYSSWPTVEFDAPVESVREISKETGEEIPLYDESPAMPGIQLSLDAGDGRLFLIP